MTKQSIRNEQGTNCAKVIKRSVLSKHRTSKQRNCSLFFAHCSLQFALCSLLFVTSCFNPSHSGSYQAEDPITGSGHENSITINISRTTSRTAGMPWMPPGTDLDNLDHTITVIDCNNGKQEVTGFRMGSTPVSFRVPIGSCSVTVKAYDGMVLMAEGSGSKTIAAGQNTIPIPMGAPTLRVVIDKIGYQGSDSLTAAPTSGKPGDSINLNYTVDSIDTGNRLEFNGVGTVIAPVNFAGTGTRPYTMDIRDNVDGVILIDGVFTHTNLTPDPIAFPVSPPVGVIYGDAPFTHALASSGTGLGTVTYYSGDTSIATVNSSTGEVTILKAGTLTITATKASDGIYAGDTAA